MFIGFSFLALILLKLYIRNYARLYLFLWLYVYV